MKYEFKLHYVHDGWIISIRINSCAKKVANFYVTEHAVILVQVLSLGNNSNDKEQVR